MKPLAQIQFVVCFYLNFYRVEKFMVTLNTDFIFSGLDGIAVILEDIEYNQFWNEVKNNFGNWRKWLIIVEYFPNRKAGSFPTKCLCVNIFLHNCSNRLETMSHRMKKNINFHCIFFSLSPEISFSQCLQVFGIFVFQLIY